MYCQLMSKLRYFTISWQSHKGLDTKQLTKLSTEVQSTKKVAQALNFN